MVTETALGKSSFGKQRERRGARVLTVLPQNVMLQADLIADVTDAQEGLRAGLCIPMRG